MADQVAIAQRQSWLAERIVRSIAKVLQGGEDAVVAAEENCYPMIPAGAGHHEMLLAPT